MPRCYYFWIIPFFLLQCAAIFSRRNDFEKGVALYQKEKIDKAIVFFEKHYSTHPFSDTTLYYLHDCYRRQGDYNAQIQTLERLAKLNILDSQVYSILLDYYISKAMYDRFFDLYYSIPASLISVFDPRYVLTRSMYAKLLVGATRTNVLQNNPMQHVIARGYLPAGADGTYFEDDTLTIGNFIIALDNLFEPTYPKTFYPMSHIPERSFLYLPYMRLVDQGILDYQRDIDPGKIARLSMVVYAIHNMVERGIID